MFRVRIRVKVMSIVRVRARVMDRSSTSVVLVSAL